MFFFLQFIEFLTLLGSQRVDDYPLIPALPSFGIGREVIVPLRYQPLLCAFYQTRILLTGKGTINGQGWSWWKAHIEERLEYTRPRLVEFYECAQVVITNLHFTQAPFWTIHPVYCDQVILLCSIYEANSPCRSSSEEFALRAF